MHSGERKTLRLCVPIVVSSVYHHSTTGNPSCLTFSSESTLSAVPNSRYLKRTCPPRVNTVWILFSLFAARRLRNIAPRSLVRLSDTNRSRPLRDNRRQYTWSRMLPFPDRVKRTMIRCPLPGRRCALSMSASLMLRPGRQRLSVLTTS